MWVTVVDVDLACSSLEAVATQTREAVAAVDARALVAARAGVTRMRRRCTCNTLVSQYTLNNQQQKLEK